MDTTTVIALYGAILSSLTMVWTIYLYRIDRHDIKLRITERYHVDYKNAFCIHIVNAGRRPIKIAGIGLCYSGPGLQRFSDNKKNKLPLFLEEAESCDFYISKYMLPSDIIFGWVRDASDKFYFIPGNRFWRLDPSTRPDRLSRRKIWKVRKFLRRSEPHGS